jgi:hypothetical protein
MYVMQVSTASHAALESAQSDFPHSLQDFRMSALVRLAKTFVGKITVTGRVDGAQQVVA